MWEEKARNETIGNKLINITKISDSIINLIKKSYVLKTSAYTKISPENIDIIKNIFMPKIENIFNILKKKNTQKRTKIFICKLNNNKKEVAVYYENKITDSAAVFDYYMNEIIVFKNIFFTKKEDSVNDILPETFPYEKGYNALIHELTHFHDPYFNVNFSDNFTDYQQYINSTEEFNAYLTSTIEIIKNRIIKNKTRKEDFFNSLKNKEKITEDFKFLKRYNEKNYNKFINIVFREINKFYESQVDKIEQ
jgi:hypothetical protein